MDDKEIIATLSALAAGYQNIQDRQVCIEDILKGSVIYPESKLNNTLIAIVFIVAIVCYTIIICFNVGY
jgi:hypothetical protein